MIKEEFTSRIRNHQYAVNQIKRNRQKIGFARGSCMLLIALCLTLFFLQRSENNALSILLTVIVVCLCVIFFFLVVKSSRLANQYEKRSQYLDINKNELKIKNFDFSTQYDGAEFTYRNHPFSKDLDLFGSQSIFQLLNRSETELGRKCMADHLNCYSEPDIPIIELRQEAIIELADNIDWRQEFQTITKQKGPKLSEIDSLLNWIRKKPTDLSSGIKVYPIFSLAIFVCCTIGIFISSTYTIACIVYAILILCNIYYLQLIRLPRNEVIKALRKNVSVLKTYHSMIKLILQSEFKSGYINQIKDKLGGSDSKNAFMQIAKIGKILDLISLRGVSYEPLNRNILYIVFNDVLLLDYFAIRSAFKWKNQNDGKIQDWLGELAEFEVLVSLASFSYANPEYVFPQFEYSREVFDAKSVGHPMIANESRYDNDIKLDKIAVVTGSNMSGKSTFLRSIGINIILANIGAPVCASYLKLSAFTPFTVMRISDSLHLKSSTFHSELLRLKMLLELIKNRKNIFFLIDEPFKGTNTKDRHSGAQALLKSLIETKQIGCFATHDIEIANSFEGHLFIKNLHFNSFIKKDQLMFDYRLKAGICSDSNASFLLSQIGL